MTKFQFYSHYKLPITTDPLKFGKLLDQTNNKFIIQLSTKNVAVINQSEKENFIRIFKNGDLILEFRDKIISDTSFIRYIYDTRFLFENDKLISTQILNALSQFLNIIPCIILILVLLFFIKWYNLDNLLEYSQLATIPFKNIIKSRKSKILNWIDFKLNVKNKIFNKSLLKTNLILFWKEIIETKISDDQHIWLLFRLQWTNNEYVTIGKLQKLNKEDMEYILNYIIDEIEDKSEYYKTTAIKSMVFSYNIKKGKAKDKVTLDNLNLNYQEYQHHKLPITMDPLKYGTLIDKIDNRYIVQINDSLLAKITKLVDKNTVKIYRKAKFAYEYTDNIINLNKFSRILGNKIFTFLNNELVLTTIDKKVNFIEPLRKANILNNNIITMDIETFIKDNIHVPYCISFYDGKQAFSYYLTHFKNPEIMIINCIKDLMVKKYDNYKVYIHNLSGFDANFLLKILVNLGTVKPIIHHDKIISINFKFKGYDVTFRDSQQLLNTSLRKLGYSFGIDTIKSIFPYNFVNENKLGYNSHVPDFNFFNDITKQEYQDYFEKFKGKFWNLETETVKYCEIDCISLYQILIKFNELIYKLFEVNIHKYPTLSSLAFAIFRTHFLKFNTIAQLSGQIAKDIRQSYTGGAVDMYIPENPDGEQVFAYDVNSLYPSQMKDKPMPIGNPTLFYGDIRNIDPNAFGFFYCKIKTPDHLDHPIIQTHIKTEDGIRTIAPLGQWEQMIFSEEMDNARKLGYQFEILWGYTFKYEYIFKEYVDFLYTFRSNYPKSNPLNYIAKLLLNSLYGRFGMIDQFPEIAIFDNKKEFNEFANIFSDDIIDIIEIGDKILVKYITEDTKRSTMLYGNLETHNVNIAIASCITAYARVHMSQFKNNPDFKLYYTDTDCIYIDKPLPDNMVDPKILGKMKLENILNKAIFLSPKVYYLITKNNEHIYKVKGLSHDINLTIDEFNNLLYKESLFKKLQIKWRKNLEDGNISVINELYTLKVTGNKRKLIYKNGKLIGTAPYIINENKEIINKNIT